MDVRIEAASIRRVGPHDLVGPCFERIFAWVAETGAVPGRVFNLSWDNPDTAAPERLCPDACVEV